MPRRHELTAIPTVALRIGPLTAEVSLAAPDEVARALEERWSCAATTTMGSDLRIDVQARQRALFGTRPGIIAGEGGAVARHDFRIQPMAGGWSIEAVVVPASIEAALRYVFGVELSKRGGLLVHGASVVLDGQGHLFLGESGAGKTTIADEGGFDRVLCDELSVVAPDGGGRYAVWPSPFWGEGRRGRAGCPAPLAGIWVLAGRDRTSAHPIGRADAVLAILRRSIELAGAPNHGNHALEAASRLVEALPVQALSWRRGDSLRGLLEPVAPQEGAQ